MKIIINDKNLGIDIMEIVDIPNVNEHFKNLSSAQWQKIKSILMVLRCLMITAKSLYKWVATNSEKEGKNMKTTKNKCV